MSIKAIFILIVVLAWSWFCYHYGTLSSKLTAATAVEKQVAHDEAQEAKDTAIINQEALDHDKAIAAAPEPTPVLVCVRKYPDPMQTTARAASRVARAPDLPKTDHRSFDPGPALAPLGRAADADIVRLQNYITHVCLVP